MPVGTLGRRARAIENLSRTLPNGSSTTHQLRRCRMRPLSPSQHWLNRVWITSSWDAPAATYACAPGGQPMALRATANDKGE